MVGYKDRPTEIGLRGVKKNLRVVLGESSGSPQILLRRWNAPVFFWDRYTTLGLKNSLFWKTVAQPWDLSHNPTVITFVALTIFLIFRIVRIIRIL